MITPANKLNQKKSLIEYFREHIVICLKRLNPNSFFKSFTAC